MVDPRDTEQAAQNFGDAVAEDLTADRTLSSELTPEQRRQNARDADNARYRQNKKNK